MMTTRHEGAVVVRAPHAIAALPTGTVIDDFDVEAVMGADDTQIHYLARDRHLLRQVAIREYAPANDAQRPSGTMSIKPTSEAYGPGLSCFLCGARALARFYDPGIIRVFGVIEAHGTAYLVTEHDPGSPLHVVIERSGPLDATRVTAVAVHTLQALQTLHAADLLHLDISPASLLLRETGQPMFVHIGQAGAPDDQHDTTVELSVSGFAPIEQSSRISPLGAWSDLYSLGCTLFQCMTGGPPPSAAKRSAVIASGGADPVDTRLATLIAGYGPGLIGAVEWMMRLDPVERPRTAAAVLAGLRPVRPAPVARAMPPAAVSSPVMTSPTPGGLAASPAVEPAFDPGSAALLDISARLAEFLGPIAGVLVKKAARDAPSRDALLARLADELASDDERRSFLNSL